MEQQLTKEITTKDSYSRFKGLSWFSNIYKKDILVIGQGGIGSWCSFLLARAGATLYTFDFDTFEAHNKSGQLVRNQDVGKNKAEALKSIIGEFCDEEVEVNESTEKYTYDSITSNIVVMGVDNMEARKIGFQNWEKYLEENPEERNNSLFIDGRLSATSLQIFCIKGNDLSSIYNYRDNFLFSDAEVQDEECTMKQTSHCAAMIASHMVAFLTNFLAPENYDVPFYYSYLIPLNFTENE